MSTREERIFHEALERLPADRDAFLDEACGGDAALRMRVERLLGADAEVPERFLVTEQEAAPEAVALEPKGRIDGFVILERLGQGGMGTVYVALQGSPRREVALKVVRAGRFGDESAARFQREIEVLGSLRHPGIAQIYQAGTTSVEDAAGGRQELPYFTMELVRGLSLTAYARERGLDVRARLELFALVCDAVHHAHLQGVVHRDLKAENVIVSEESTGASRRANAPAILPSVGPRIGQPKILDFGIARLLDEDDVDAQGRGWTRPGDVVGTLTHISPEQLRGEAIDARADVYSLGVLLYELLAERLPFDLSGRTTAEALRILERETPPPLSRWKRSLAGDPSVLAAKALAREPERRYASAAALAEDVRRHLSGDPILARADSRLYVLHRTLRRHRTFATATALVIALLASFAVLFRRQAIDNAALAQSEASARRAAERALTKSRIDRGRLLGRTGNAAGERLLWNELLAAPESRAARWALREFYATHSWTASTNHHEGKVRALAFDARGTLLASAGDDGFLRLSDPRTLGPVRAPLELSELVFSLAFSPGGDLLYGGTSSGEVHVWDPVSGERLRTFEVGDGAVRCLAVDPRTGSVLAGGDHGARLYTADGEAARTFEGVERVVLHAAFSANGSELAIAGVDGLWLVPNPLHGPALRLRVGQSTGGVVFEAGPRRLLSTGADGRLLAWDLSGLGDEAPELGVPKLLAQHARPRTMRAGPRDGEVLLLFDNRVEHVAVDRGELLASIPLTDRAFGMARSEGRLVVGDVQGRVRVWDLERRAIRRFGPFEAGAQAAVHPETGRLWIGTGNGERLPLEPGHAFRGEGDARPVGNFGPSWRSDGPPRDFGNAVTWMDWTADGRAIWSTMHGELRVEISETASSVLAEGLYTRRAAAFALAPDRTRVALTKEGGFELLALDGSASRTPLAQARWPYSVTWSPGGRYLAAIARSDDALLLHDLSETSAKPRRLHHPPHRPLCATFTPDETLLAVGSWERGIHVWDPRSATLLAELQGHEGAVWDLAVLATDPLTLASLGADGTLRTWSLDPPQELATFPVPATSHRGFLVPLPQARLAVTSGDGTLLVFDLARLDTAIEATRGFAATSYGH